MTKEPFTAANWSDVGDSFTEMFYNQQVAQFWLESEIPIFSDLNTWKKLTDDERWVYIHASAGLNALDTLQGEFGMVSVANLVDSHARKATIMFQGAMENIHAKSYSMMNKTFLSSSEEREIFEWVKENVYLQNKISVIKAVYDDPSTSDLAKWKKYVISCMLETGLFYSGFFYPLYLAGQGKMTNTAEIFRLIIRDEQLHGVYISLLAKEVFEKLDEEQQESALDWFIETSHELYMNELRYTEYLYERLGTEIVHEVKKFIRFNFNNLTDNLDIERIFDDEEVLPSVLNGINTDTKTHDFFSAKGQGYGKIKVEPLKNEDFDIFKE